MTNDDFDGERVTDSTTPSAGTPGEQTDEFTKIVRRQLELLGEDPDREGLVRTPHRVAASLAWLTRGYEMDVTQVVNGALFDAAGATNMVMVRDVELYSMCEHHMLPFYGRAHLAYIPNGKIVGLSKLPRIVEVFARRLQVQERLTEEIAGAIDEILKPQGVGVVVEAYHLCMMMRGVEKQNSKTITSAVRGSFRSDQLQLFAFRILFTSGLRSCGIMTCCSISHRRHRLGRGFLGDSNVAWDRGRRRRCDAGLAKHRGDHVRCPATIPNVAGRGVQVALAGVAERASRRKVEREGGAVRAPMVILEQVARHDQPSPGDEPLRGRKSGIRQPLRHGPPG